MGFEGLRTAERLGEGLRAAGIEVAEDDPRPRFLEHVRQRRSHVTHPLDMHHAATEIVGAERLARHRAHRREDTPGRERARIDGVARLRVYAVDVRRGLFDHLHVLGRGAHVHAGTETPVEGLDELSIPA